MSAPDLPEEAARWLAFAEDDLRLARVILSVSDVKPGQACYHAQQAGEKAIKAALVLAGVPLTRTHDLVRLAMLAPTGWQVKLSPTDLADLSRWAVDSRYPDAAGAVEASGADAQAAVAFAEQVVEAARLDLDAYG
jgi:HEPN domain-containing protein